MPYPPLFCLQVPTNQVFLTSLEVPSPSFFVFYESGPGGQFLNSVPNWPMRYVVWDAVWAVVPAFFFVRLRRRPFPLLWPVLSPLLIEPLARTTKLTHPLAANLPPQPPAAGPPPCSRSIPVPPLVFGVKCPTFCATDISLRLFRTGTRPTVPFAARDPDGLCAQFPFPFPSGPARPK